MVKISIVHLPKDADQNQYNDFYLWGPKSELSGCHFFQWLLGSPGLNFDPNELEYNRKLFKDHPHTLVGLYCVRTFDHYLTQLCCCCCKSQLSCIICVSGCDSGVVGRSWRYCNARPTRDRAEASFWTPSPYKNQFNIEEVTWTSYQILSW